MQINIKFLYTLLQCYIWNIFLLIIISNPLKMVQKQVYRNTSHDDMSTRRLWLKREDSIKVDLK